MPQAADTTSAAPLHRPAGLTGPAWRSASRRLIEKALAEFSYEELLAPQPAAGEPAPAGAAADYRLPYADGARQGEYRFRARRGAYGSWRIAPGSVRRDDRPAEDALALLQDLHHALGLGGDTAGHLVRELNATLLADVALDARPLTAAQLADLDYAELEGHQTGHPWIVPNKGRLGFSASEAARWAPEARRATRLPWIAVHRSLATYRSVPGLTSDRLYTEELPADTRRAFAAALADRGRDALDYLYLPVHPWQWDQVVAPLFAPQLADDHIIPLGTDNDLRIPQQSVRTFLNITRSDARAVKLPLSVLNTLVWRGLPTERTLAAPAVTAWVHGLRDADPYLREECRVILLGETASVAVPHPALEAVPGVPYQYRELLGAIWREPLAPLLESGERARTLAALLRTDPDGRALTAELVTRSGLEPRAWLRRLFEAMLPPLLHFLYRYGLVFSPHGENAIVVFDEREVPVRLAVKDFVDDVNVSAKPLPELESMPPEVAAVLLRERPDHLCQFIHSGLFVGVYRYLAPLAESQLGVDEADFWGMVRETVLAEQRRFPGLAERHDLFDLLTPRIDRLCLNRNRLLLDGYRDRPQRPHAAVHGMVPNPLAAPSAARAAVPGQARASRTAPVVGGGQ